MPMRGQDPNPKPVSELTFEQALDELDALVRRMEAGELGLDDALAAYRRGAELTRHCQAGSPSPSRKSASSTATC